MTELQVNFTSYYAGDHRICWRLGFTDPYDCSTIVTCTGGGVACSANIPVLVTNESCGDQNFNGYVQAVCEPVESLVNRIPFNTVFSPENPCKLWVTTCECVGISGYTIVNPGAGYVGIPIDMTGLIVGGGGSGAMATAYIGNGGIKTFTITNGGSLYTPDAVYTNVVAQTLTGGGSAAIFDVTVAGGIVTNVVLTSADLAPGSGYAATDTFEFLDADLGGGGGSGVVITVDTINTGQVQYVTVDAVGAGYSSEPTITMPSGFPITTQAIIEPIMGQCSGDWDYELDCDSNALGLQSSKPLGFVFKKCSAVAPNNAPVGYVTTNVGCCYDCVTVSFTNNDTQSVNIFYTDCITGAVTLLNVLAEATEIVCAVDNSWFYSLDADLTISTNPGCV